MFRFRNGFDKMKQILRGLAIGVLLIAISLSSVVSAQTIDVASTNSSIGTTTGTLNRSKYISTIDDALFIKNIAIIKAEDNVQSVYDNSVKEFLESRIAEDSFWVLAKKLEGSLAQEVARQQVDAFETNFSLNKKILQSCSCQAFFVAKISKSLNQTNLKLTLFTGPEGLPLIQETYQAEDLFETEKVNKKFAELYENIKNRLPFGGYILSRRGDELTLNVGRNRDVQDGSRITVVQILNIKRHPKFYFMTETVKEVLGHLKIYKVENDLSFARVEYEKEPGLIGVGAKAIIEKSAEVALAREGSRDRKRFNSIEETDLAYGASPREWTPPPEPQFGRLWVALRLSDYSQNSKLSTGETSEAKNGFVPGIKLGAEVWFTDKIIANIQTVQTVYTVSNNLASSTPSKISMSQNQLALSVGYNFFIEDDFFGPKVTLYGGYDMRSYKASSTEPIAITSMSYSGLFIGAAGLFDLPTYKRLQLGADVRLYLFPSLSEAPRSSGSSKNTLTSFAFIGLYHWKPNYNLKADLNFDYVSTDFSGTGTRTNRADSTTHKETALSLGFEYLF